MTGNDVLTHARRLLKDEVEGRYRWPDSALIIYLNQALGRLYMERPDLKLQADDTIDIDDPLTDGTETLLVPEKFKSALGIWVSFCALQEDGEDAANLAVARVYEEKFMKEIRL